MERGKNGALRLLGILLPVLITVLALCAVPVRADAPYKLPGAAAVGPEDQWGMQLFGVTDERYLAIYDRVREEIETDIAKENFLNDEDVKELDLSSYSLSNTETNDLSACIRRVLWSEYGTVVSYFNLSRSDGSLKATITYNQYYAMAEYRDPMLAEAEKIMAAAGITAENVNTLSDYEKAQNLHDALLSHVAYRKAGPHQETYGALVQGECVCAGYAHAYQFLLSQAGIPSLYVTGLTGMGPHAWNILRLNGVWYECDPTWNDSSGGITYSYYCVSSDRMETYHRKDTSIYVNSQYKPLCYPECSASLPRPGEIRYTVLTTEAEGYSFYDIYSATRGGTILFSLEIDPDYFLGEDFRVTASGSGIVTRQGSTLMFAVTEFMDDVVITVEGVEKKPGLAEGGYRITVGGDLYYHGMAQLGEKVLPADAGTLSWWWVVDGMPIDYFVIEGEFARIVDYTGDKPYGLLVTEKQLGPDHSIALRVKADNYSGFLESEPVTVTGKCPTEIVRLASSGETNVGSKFTFSVSDSNWREKGGNVARTSPSGRPTVSVVGVGSLEDKPNKDVYTWTPTEAGDYILRVEFPETEHYLGAAVEIPIRVYPKGLTISAPTVTLSLSFSGEGVTVKCTGHGANTSLLHLLTFYDENGRYLGMGSMDSKTYTAFTVSGVEDAAYVQVVTVDEHWAPFTAVTRQDLGT